MVSYMFLIFFSNKKGQTPARSARYSVYLYRLWPGSETRSANLSCRPRHKARLSRFALSRLQTFASDSVVSKMLFQKKYRSTGYTAPSQAGLAHQKGCTSPLIRGWSLVSSRSEEHTSE